MPKIIGGTTDEHLEDNVFVSLEETPLVLSHLRRVLPQLKRELSRKWPVQHVAIQYRVPAMKNPSIHGARVVADCLGLLMTFGKGALQGAGGWAGIEVLKFVKGWIKRLAKPKPALRKSIRRRRRLIGPSQ